MAGGDFGAGDTDSTTIVDESIAGGDIWGDLAGI
jgi:hypothetical protein